MVLRTVVFLALAVGCGAAFLAGCKSETSVIDDNSYEFVIPHISQSSATPSSINSATLLPATKSLYDSVTINLSVSLTISSNTPPDSISSATAMVYDPEGLLCATYSFLSPSTTAKDSVLTGSIAFKILRLKVGTYTVNSVIATADGNTANSLAAVNITDSAFHPPIVSDFTSADSISVPGMDTLSAQVTDPFGAGSIDSVNAAVYDATNRFVKLLSFTSSGNNKYVNYFATDSTYRRESWYVLYIYALDTSHVSSDTLMKVIYTR